MTLTQAQREVVVSAIDAACAFRGWELHVLHVRTTHVHMLVSTGVPPAEVLRLVKAWATRRLREARLVPRLRPVWTAYGSTRYIWSEADNGVDLAVRGPWAGRPAPRRAACG